MGYMPVYFNPAVSAIVIYLLHIFRQITPYGICLL
ncbi:hypothetical protein DET0912 [Dehalococcoides mccartyi 195]|uniref:Uncharacterized protein n=1 Tax=Dehalococcoides mccartyi (strain ATCC BAA-2266 / KCTC 15142 / 195) TaxID=243164 RepID=Q3Z812_DEHM1|nr:hypothetical protein DET0912 [Dehalococcoides mccartyi 195]